MRPSGLETGDGVWGCLPLASAATAPSHERTRCHGSGSHAAGRALCRPWLPARSGQWGRSWATHLPRASGVRLPEVPGVRVRFGCCPTCCPLGPAHPCHHGQGQRAWEVAADARGPGCEGHFSERSLGAAHRSRDSPLKPEVMACWAQVSWFSCPTCFRTDRFCVAQGKSGVSSGSQPEPTHSAKAPQASPVPMWPLTVYLSYPGPRELSFPTSGPRGGREVTSLGATFSGCLRGPCSLGACDSGRDVEGGGVQPKASLPCIQCFSRTWSFVRRGVDTGLGAGRGRHTGLAFRRSVYLSVPTSFLKKKKKQKKATRGHRCTVRGLSHLQ